MRVACGAGSRPEFRRRRKGEDSNPGGRCICAYANVGFGCSSSVHCGRTTCVESVLPNGGDGGCGRIGIRGRPCVLGLFREHGVPQPVECVHWESGQSAAGSAGGDVWARSVGGHFSSSTNATAGELRERRSPNWNRRLQLTQSSAPHYADRRSRSIHSLPDDGINSSKLGCRRKSWKSQARIKRMPGLSPTRRL